MIGVVMLAVAIALAVVGAAIHRYQADLHDEVERRNRDL